MHHVSGTNGGEPIFDLRDIRNHVHTGAVRPDDLSRNGKTLDTAKASDYEVSKRFCGLARRDQT